MRDQPNLEWNTKEDINKICLMLLIEIHIGGEIFINNILLFYLISYYIHRRFLININIHRNYNEFLCVLLSYVFEMFLFSIMHYVSIMHGP